MTKESMDAKLPAPNLQRAVSLWEALEARALIEHDEYTGTLTLEEAQRVIDTYHPQLAGDDLYRCGNNNII
jgi:hypothetical protein